MTKLQQVLKEYQIEIDRREARIERANNIEDIVCFIVVNALQVVAVSVGIWAIVGMMKG